MNEAVSTPLFVKKKDGWNCFILICCLNCSEHLLRISLLGAERGVIQRPGAGSQLK